MSTINKNNIFITNHVYINEYNNKNSIFIIKHVYTIITISQVLKAKNMKFQTVREEVSLRTH